VNAFKAEKAALRSASARIAKTIKLYTKLFNQPIQTTGGLQKNSKSIDLK
jgi:hypothetical protein